MAYRLTFDFLVVFCHTLTLAHLQQLSSNISDEIPDQFHGFRMLQDLVMVGFHGLDRPAMPSSLHLPGQNTVAVLIDEWIESVVSHQVQHRFVVFSALHVAYEMSVAGYLRDQFAPAQIYLQQV